VRACVAEGARSMPRCCLQLSCPANLCPPSYIPPSPLTSKCSLIDRMCRAGQYGGPVPNLTINTNNTGQQSAATLGDAGSPLYENGNYPYSSFGYDQFSWFLNDIGRVDRGRTPWVIVAWHQPPYNSYSTHYKEFECGRQQIEPILYQNGVDIVMHGHVHAYERTFPVNNYAVDQCGMRWITIGDGGNIEGLYKTFASQNGTCYCSAQTSSGTSNGCPCLDVLPTTKPQARPRGARSPSCHRLCQSPRPDWPTAQRSSMGACATQRGAAGVPCPA
jgi:hypothetical protein